MRDHADCKVLTRQHELRYHANPERAFPERSSSRNGKSIICPRSATSSGEPCPNVMFAGLLIENVQRRKKQETGGHAPDDGHTASTVLSISDVYTTVTINCTKKTSQTCRVPRASRLKKTRKKNIVGNSKKYPLPPHSIAVRRAQHGIFARSCRIVETRKTVPKTVPNQALRRAATERAATTPLSPPSLVLLRPARARPARALDRRAALGRCPSYRCRCCCSWSRRDRWSRPPTSCSWRPCPLSPGT